LLASDGAADSLLRSSSRSRRVAHGKPPSQAHLPPADTNIKSSRGSIATVRLSMRARELLRRRNRHAAAHSRPPAIADCLLNPEAQSRPSGEMAIGGNLHLQKSGISKYRIGTK
jgi:hypothetical protein